MSVALRKVKGVESVKVSLNEGVADIKLKSGNRVSIDKIREFVRSNGFTPKEADVTIAGKVVERGGKAALQVSELETVYLLVDHPDAKGRTAELQKSAMGKDATVTGRVPEPKEKAEEPSTIEVRSFSVK